MLFHRGYVTKLPESAFMFHALQFQKQPGSSYVEIILMHVRLSSF